MPLGRVPSRFSTQAPADQTADASSLLLLGALEKSAAWILRHCFSVAEICWTLAATGGPAYGKPDHLWLAGMLHDLGKLGVSRAILEKPTGLTEQEFAQVQNHSFIGYVTLQRLVGDWIVATSSLHHHERFDGTGYPGRLAGTAIPLCARLVAVADSYDAMRALRPYRGRCSHEEAVAELRACAGRQFDPELVAVFERAAGEIGEGFEASQGLGEASILAAVRDRLEAVDWESVTPVVTARA